VIKISKQRSHKNAFKICLTIRTLVLGSKTLKKLDFNRLIKTLIERENFV
jgi:hypothetical protein